MKKLLPVILLTIGAVLVSCRTHVKVYPCVLSMVQFEQERLIINEDLYGYGGKLYRGELFGNISRLGSGLEKLGDYQFNLTIVIDNPVEYFSVTLLRGTPSSQSFRIELIDTKEFSGSIEISQFTIDSEVARDTSLVISGSLLNGTFNLEELIKGGIPEEVKL